MQVVGIGVDLVSVARLGAALERAPRLAERIFVPSERALGLASLAARFAAKEAFAKALGSPRNLAWHDAWIIGGGTQPPRFAYAGSVAARCAQLGVSQVHVSLSHDKGLALAYVMCTG